MPDKNTISDERLTEFLEIVRSFMRMRHRLKPVIPEELARARKHLSELLPSGQEWGQNDFDLFFSIGLILSRQRAPMTMGALSQALDVPLSTATRTVDHLVKHDYAERLPDPDDRRVVRVGLTQTGMQMYHGIQGFFETRVRHIMSYFTDDEQEDLLRLMRKLQAAVSEEDRGSG